MSAIYLKLKLIGFVRNIVDQIMSKLLDFKTKYLKSIMPELGND